MKTNTRQQNDYDTAQQLVLEFLEMINKETFDQARKMLCVK
jgi:hypothetical protein